MNLNGIPLPDPVAPVCANCRRNVSNVCTYAGHGGNALYPDGYTGRPITWDRYAVHCGQHLPITAIHAKPTKRKRPKP